MDAMVLNDGLLRFKLRNTETGEETAHALDVLLLRLACEECESRHNLQTTESGAYKPTRQFLSDLANEIAALGVPDCTSSVAYQLWSASASAIDGLKKNTSETQNSPTGLESSQPSTSESATSESLAESAALNASAY